MTEEIKPKREFLSTVYIVKDGKVLLRFHDKLKKFIPLGGHIEQDELPCESVIREAKEESGFDIELIDNSKYKSKNIIQNIGLNLDIIKPDHHHINLAYVGRIKGGVQREKCDEGTELKWFSGEELVEGNTFDNVKEFGLMAIEISKSSQLYL